MSSWIDLLDEMQRVPLDTDTADRLLAGSVLPADAPPGYGEVARLLTDEAEEVTGIDPRRESDTITMLVGAVRSSQTETKRSPRRSSVHRRKIATALVAAALTCTTGLALGAGLPGAAQDIASSMLTKAGITAPGPNSNAGDHPSTRGQSAVDVTAGTSGKGSEISELARTTELTGVEKGAAISTLASGGKSRAGQHGSASAERAPVTTPNAGGTPTADAASGGASSPGTAAADTASDGHSAAGSANAEAGQDHRP
jgi:hypothetical protein